MVSILQTHKAISLFESKYPSCQGLFVFDNAPSHTKRPENALNADRMNVRDGGKQPFMQDTMWSGQVQKMVTEDGLQNGMKTVLDERGIDIKGMNASKMKEELLKFKASKTHMNTKIAIHNFT